MHRLQAHLTPEDLINNLGVGTDGAVLVQKMVDRIEELEAQLPPPEPPTGEPRTAHRPDLIPPPSPAKKKDDDDEEEKKPHVPYRNPKR